MSGAYLIAVALIVPVATFLGLWLWRLRRNREFRRPALPGSEGDMTRLATGLHTRQEQLQAQLTTLYSDWQHGSAREDGAARPRPITEPAASGVAEAGLGMLLDGAGLAAAVSNREELLQRITDFVVPSLADYCVAYLPSADERLRVAAVANADPARAAAFGRVRGRSIAVSGPLTAQTAYRTGAVQLVPDVSAVAATWAAAEPALAEVMGGARAQSALAVPLTSVGRRLGVLVMGRHTARAAFADSDIAMAEELSRRLATALANADSFARERIIAETLQRSLLPDALPAVPGMDLAVEYLPASDGAAVGGDWYDAIPLQPGRLGLIVGDVVGHSITSASVMGQIRTLLRTCILDFPSPDEVLRRANVALARLLPEAMATVACLVLDRRTRELSYASAGHPPPLLTSPSGTAYLEDVTGIMLGTGADIPFTSATRRLTPGSGLLLYTDGLVEGPQRDITTGMHTLAGALRLATPRSAEQMCTIAHRAMLGNSPRADDVCLLAARIPP